MSNRMFLVCDRHPNIEDAFCVAERVDQGYEAANLKRASDWFEKHKDCGPPDHFQLAHHRPLNWDQPTLADPVPNAVRLALVQ